MTRSYENPAEFTKQLAVEYLSYLNSSRAHIPFESRAQVLEDIAAEAHELLVKKMYGCVQPEELSTNGRVVSGQEGSPAKSGKAAKAKSRKGKSKPTNETTD